MRNKGLNLKVMFAIIGLSVGAVSCNQPTANTNTATNDSTKTEKAVTAAPVTATETSTTPVSAFDGDYSIVFINTDSLVSQYKFFTDGNDKMIKVEKTMRNRYEIKAKKLQREYEEYMKQGKAGLLTLKQQQDTEASLTKQQQDLTEMDKSMSERLMMQKQMLNKQINDTVAAFIDTYRIEKGYTLILQKQTLNGVLSADPALDVTADVINRLNAKYDFDVNHN